MKMQRRFQNMNIFENAAGVAMLRWGKQSLVFLLSLALLFTTLPQNLSAQDAPARRRRTTKPRRRARQRRPMRNRVRSSCSGW